MRKKRNLLALASLFTLLLTFGVGCDLMSVLDRHEGGGQGSLRILLTDAPFPYDLVAEANVTITHVEAENAGKERFVLLDDTVSLNLLDLRNGVTTLLGEAEALPAGRYPRILLDVSDAEVVMKTGIVYTMKVPSGQIKVLVNNLVVTDSEEVTLTLDFDVNESFVMQGNLNTPAGIKGFLFKPVVKSLGWKRHREKLEVEGAIEEVGADFVVVNGRRFEVTAGTKFDGFNALADLTVGTEVEVEYVERPDGTLVAVEIEKEDGEDDDDERETHEIKGAVQEVGADFFAVADQQFLVNARTQFKGLRSFAALAVDMNVEVKYVVQEDGRFRAVRVSKED